MTNKLKCKDSCLLIFINYSLYVIIDFTEYIFHKNDSQTTLQVFTCAITLDGLKVVFRLDNNTLKL